MQVEVALAAGGEIIQVAQREVEIAHPECRHLCGEHLCGLFAGRQQPRGCQPDHRQHQQQRRQQPPKAAYVERQQPDAASAGGFLHQLAGDQEAGQDEEHIHAHKAAGQPWNTSMCRYDQEDGDRAQAFDVRAK